MGDNMMGEAPVMVRITGDNLDTLRELADRLAERMHNVKGLREIKSSVEEGRPEYRVKIKRDDAAHYGLNTAQVAQTVRTVVEGSTATRYRAGADSIDVVVRGQREDRKDLDQLENLLLLTPKGARVSLSSVADLGIAKGPVTIERSGQVRYVEVTADMVGRSLGDVVEDIQAEADEMHMPMGYNLEFTGEFEQMTQSFEDLTTAFLMAAVLIYGILAVQFESFYHPLTIMLSIPLAIVGVVGGLLVTGRTLNVSGFIGIIMLAGIVVNNAIVLIDYVNQLRRRGQERGQAVRTAGRIRLRPILMTAMTTVLAMLPMAFAVKEGTEMEAPLATVIVFGLSFATLLTLIFIPVMYTLLEDLASTLSSWVTPVETTVEEAGSGD
jgi:HAE1 family hydrophobic/amphiphilic exporter-1